MGNGPFLRKGPGGGEIFRCGAILQEFWRRIQNYSLDDCVVLEAKDEDRTPTPRAGQ